MKSIFSTQNLQTFFLRKYCRLPRGRPPGPPGPPGPPSRRPPPGPPCAPPEPPSRRGAGPPGAGVCFCSSAITFTLSHFTPALPEQILNFLLQDHVSPPTAGRPPPRLTCGRGLFLRGRGRSRAARTPRGTLFTLVRQLLLALQVFVEPHGLIFNHRVLHAQPALQLGNQLAVRGANLLVHIDAFTVLGYAIG